MLAHVKQDRPPLAESLRRARIAAGYSNQEKAAAAIRAATSVVGLTNSQYASYESGDPRRPFQQKHRDAIEQVLGPLEPETPVSVAPAASGDLSALVQAIDRQTAAITALVERLDRQATEGPEWAEATVRAVLAGLQLGTTGSRSSVRPGRDDPR